MALLKIHIYGDPVLRQKAAPVEEITPELETLVQDMIETMRENEGIGLSANQVGDLRQVIVIDMALFDEQFPPLAMFNVEITDPQGIQTHEEGCLSIPGIREDVERPDQITVTFMSIDGSIQKITVAGMLSRVIQHEQDHLDGIMFVDRIPPVRRTMLATKLKKLAKGELVS